MQRIAADASGKDKQLLHEELTYRIIGILFKIHSSLGCGFPEKIYQRAIGYELDKEKIDYENEKQIEVLYDKKKNRTFPH